MFRRKEEGTDQMFPEAPTDVQVPPAPQSTASDASTTDATATASSTSPYGAPTSFSTAPKPAAAFGTPAAAATTPAASPYRAAGTPTGTTPSSTSGMSSTGSNVTELSGRNRFSETTNRTGSTGMDKNVNKSGSKNRVLTVGNDILMKGEINSCDRIVIEGAVDATLKEVHTMEIAQSGSFKGFAEVEEAEISGIVEGDLTVRGRLIIYSTGKVTGKISYGEIEIERGGQLTGEIKSAGVSGTVKTKEAA